MRTTKMLLTGALALWMSVFSSNSYADVVTMNSTPILDASRILESGYINILGTTVNSWVPDTMGPTFDVRFNAYQSRFGQNLLIPANWSGSNLVGVVLQNMETYPVTLRIAISTQPDENNFTNGFSGQIDMPANSTQRYTFYFSEPAPPNVDMKVLPKPWDGQYVKVYGNNNCNLANIRSWRLSCHTPAGARVKISQMAKVNYSLTLTDVVDDFFQYTDRDWNDKIYSVQDLLDAKAAEETDLNNYPSTGQRFGATNLPNQGTNPRWRITTHNNKKFFVHPNGRLFWSFGLNGIHDMRSTRIAGRESMFTSVPSPSGPNADLYWTTYNPSGQPVQVYNVVRHNLRMKYPAGTNLRDAFLAITRRRLDSWGINTISATAVPEMYDNVRPFVYYLNTTTFPTHIPVPVQAWVPPPDPYAPNFQSWMTTQFTAQLANFNGDQNFMGVFVDNEMSWGHTLSNSTLIDRYSVALGVLSAPANQPAKQEMIRTLKARYRTVTRLNYAWRRNFASWTSLNSPISITQVSQITPSMQKDFKDFTGRFASAYFTKVRAALTASGCTALYLGCRFWHRTPEVIAAASTVVDVLSFNDYSMRTEIDWNYFNSLRKPVLISEWNVIMDEGPTLGNHHISRPECGSRMQDMFGFVMSQPNIVGMHLFELYDQPVTNRGQDWENMGVGILNITDTPHKDTVNALRWAAMNMYTIRN